MHDVLTPLSSQVVSPQQQQAHFDANIEGGLKGLLIGAGITIPAWMLLNRRVPSFRAAPLAMKSFGGVVIMLPSIMISAEKAGEQYDRSQWTGIGKQELDFQAKKEHERWESLTSTEKLGDWAKRRRWGIITGS